MIPPVSTGLPPVSLIIPTRNRPDLLRDTVRSILSGREVPAEILIVDQSDHPQTDPSHLRQDLPCQIQYLLTQPHGVSQARNTGARLARFDLLVFTDDDVVVDPGWLGELVRALQCNAARPGSVVTGRVLPAGESVPGNFAPSTQPAEEAAVFEQPGDRDLLYSANMAIHRRLFESVGGFDERLGPGTGFPSAEDNDLGYRLLRSGCRLVYAPQALLYHRAWRSRDDYLALRWRYGLGRGGYYSKHLRSNQPYMGRRLLKDLRDHTLPAFRHVINGAPDRALGDLALTGGLLIGAARWLLTGGGSNHG